jgi:hypothetical protein
VSLEALGGVSGDAQINRLAAGMAYQRNQCVGVAAGDLSTAQDLFRLVDVHDFIATAQDSYTRSAIDKRMAHSERGQHSQVRRPQLGTDGEHGSTLPDVLAHATDVYPHVTVFDDGDRL